MTTMRLFHDREEGFEAELLTTLCLPNFRAWIHHEEGRANEGSNPDHPLPPLGQAPRQVIHTTVLPYP